MSPERLFRLLADRTRLRCLALLRVEGSLCVCELTHALEMSQPKVSRHLAMLRDGGLVEDERRGQWVHYRLRKGLPDWVDTVIAAALQGDAGLPWQVEDRRRLTAMAARPSADICAS